MTGFGQAAAETERLRVAVTLRGVNHRFLDLSLRLRDEYRRFEPALREQLNARLHRGRVEVTVEIEALAARRLEIEIDQPLAEAVRDLAATLAEQGVIRRGPTFGDLLRLPHVVNLRARAVDWTEADDHTLEAVVAEALEQLVRARQTEGEKLAAVLDQRLGELESVVASLRVRGAEVPALASAALHQRLAELAGEVSLDADRLAQEVALLADRSDVTEEIDRLRAHLEHFRSTMGEPGSLGKRLDFLTQEIFRELNTVASKCRDSDMVRWVLAGKAACEQIREQVQNVE